MMKKTINIIKWRLVIVILILFFTSCAGAPERSSEDFSEKKYVSSQLSITPSKKKKKSLVEYDKEVEYLKNKLRTAPNDSETYYNLSSIYLSLRDFKNSHQYINEALKYAKDMGYKRKYGVFLTKIEEDCYKYSKLKKSIKEYKIFLNLFSRSSYYEDIRKRLESIMYDKAVRVNKKELYSEFLLEFPDSKDAKIINGRLEEIAFEEALKINTVEHYQGFIRRSPFSEYKEIILDKIDRLRFENVRNIDTVEAYRGFIKKYPGNKYINDAKERIIELKFARVEEGDSIEDYIEYIKDNPDGIFVNSSLEKIAELRYKKAKNADSIEALQEFIKSYPDSEYVYKAEKLLDVLRYEIVEKKDTVEAYEAFIKEYPDSEFKYDAKERIEELDKKSRIKSLCDKGEKDIESSSYEKALKSYTEALNIDYSSRAQFGIGRLYELIGDTQEDYNKKIEYYYKAIAAFKVILRKAPGYENIMKVLDKLLGKRSKEQKIMNDAKLAKQNIPFPFSARFITYSKSPIINFKNVGRKGQVMIDIKNNDGKTLKRLNIMPQSETKKTFETGKVFLSVKGIEMDEVFPLELFPYYEYILRVK
jgi:outer membrane protein assembly factor BamD (BamD/ComL family)